MKKFAIKFKKLIAGKHFGSFQSIFSGSWLEVNDFRKYMSGDAFKTINWKLSAKHNELFINKFNRDQEIELDIFLDINYNRRWKKDKKDKRNYIYFMDYFADIIVYCRKHFIPIQLFYPKPLWKKFTYKITPTLHHIKTTKDLTPLHSFLQQFPKIVKQTPNHYISTLPFFLQQTKKIRKRRAIIIFSDFLDIKDTDIKILNMLHKEHALYLFRIPINPYSGQNYCHTIVNQDKLHTNHHLPVIDRVVS